MAEWIIGTTVLMIMGLLALWGERFQAWWGERRLSRHTCHTTCHESWSCRCGCRDGLYGVARETRCAVCGTELVWPEAKNVNQITHEMPAPPGFTSWGWERDREFRKVRRDMGRGSD